MPISTIFMGPRRLMRLALLLAITLWPAIGMAQAPRPAEAADSIPPRIPTAAFAAMPRLKGLKVAPDGRHIVGRRDADGTTTLLVMSLEREQAPLAIGLPDHWMLGDYRWAGSNRVLMTVYQLSARDETVAVQARLIVYDIPTRTPRFIGARRVGPLGDIVYVDRSGDWILLAQQEWAFDWPAVFRINLADNHIEQVQAQRQDIWTWVADETGVVRLGIGSTGDKYRIVYRSGPDETFRTVARPIIKDEDERSLASMTILRGSDDGYVLSNDATGRYALHRFNFATRTLGEAVFENAVNDIDDYEMTSDGRNLLYASFIDDRPHIHWFDPDMARLQRGLDAALPTRQNRMISWSDDRKTIVVHATDSNEPGSFYIYLPAEHTLSPYLTQYPDLHPEDLARTEYVHYTARDGLEIPAYLTLPKGRAPHGLPLIIMPHGGPFEVRDSLRFDAQVQMFANRGYAVLQPNYRGSGGYGEDFSNKGYGQWGRAMQDDLDDGMDWLVGRGIVDPARVCLVGASYGGYAALWGAVRNPERYRCAASFAGVSDLGRLLSYSNKFFIAPRYQKDWRDKIRGVESFNLGSVSPLRRIGGLRVPLLFAHGLKDANVPYRQSSDFAAALRSAGKTFEFHSYAEEAHGFSKPENLEDWLNRLDAFLARYNPASTR